MIGGSSASYVCSMQDLTAPGLAVKPTRLTKASCMVITPDVGSICLVAHVLWNVHHLSRRDYKAIIEWTHMVNDVVV